MGAMAEYDARVQEVEELFSEVEALLHPRLNDAEPSRARLRTLDDVADQLQALRDLLQRAL